MSPGHALQAVGAACEIVGLVTVAVGISRNRQAFTTNPSWTSRWWVTVKRFGGRFRRKRSLLSWEELPAKRACRIAVYGLGDVLTSDEHEAYIDWFFDTSRRLREALEPRA